MIIVALHLFKNRNVTYIHNLLLSYLLSHGGFAIKPQQRLFAKRQWHKPRSGFYYH
jgi:hypothetical protein